MGAEIKGCGWSSSGQKHSKPYASLRQPVGRFPSHSQVSQPSSDRLIAFAQAHSAESGATSTPGLHVFTTQPARPISIQRVGLTREGPRKGRESSGWATAPSLNVPLC